MHLWVSLQYPASGVFDRRAAAPTLEACCVAIAVHMGFQAWVRETMLVQCGVSYSSNASYSRATFLGFETACSVHRHAVDAMYVF